MPCKYIPKPILFISFDNEYKRDKSIFSKYNLYSDISSLEKEGLCKILSQKEIFSVVCGNCKIGKGSLIGANTTVIHQDLDCKTI